MELNPKPESKTETLNVSITKHITVNELLENTKQRMGDNFFLYSAYNNNCQHFISNLLVANGLDTPENIAFVKQDTEQIFQNLDYLRKLSNTITDLAGRVDVVHQGGSLNFHPNTRHNGLNSDEINRFLKSRNIAYNGVYSKDRLPNTLKNGWYIVNMQNERDGNGTHWVAMKYGSIIEYYDSFGFYPPIEIMERAKRDILYSSKQIQDIKSTACGWFCIACIIDDYYANPTLNQKRKFENFAQRFSVDTTKNDSILYQLIF